MIALLLAAQMVSGTVRYEDRDYGPGGFSGGITPRPVAWADVDILQSGSSTILQSGTTDANGDFSLGPIAAGTTVFARIYARHSGNQIHLQILNNSTQKAVYTVASPDLDTGVGLSFGTILLTLGGAAPAFNIYDCGVKSFVYQATVDAGLPATPPLLKIYWELNAGIPTGFNRGSDAIFLLGTTADPDQYDDDIILHEIGHWVAFHFSKDDTLGGPHFITDQLDPRTAWSEGWAHYWSATVRRHFPAEYGSPQVFVDNLGGGGSNAFEIEGPTSPAQTVGATNEVAVAAVLWDITDAANEVPFDGLSGIPNEVSVWNAVHVQIPLLSVITLEDFREGLSAVDASILGAVTGSEATDGIMKARGILYYLDSSESNGNAASAAALALGLTGVADRTFFPAGDADYYAVALTPGVLLAETFNLGDGADTRLELLAPDGTTVLASNDDRAAGDKSSLVQYAVPVAATYYLRVTNVSLVVENGHYDLRAQIVPNAPPLVASVSASTIQGEAPLRVTLSGVATDFENAYLDYQWDFTGSGRFVWSSLSGPRVTTTYAKPGIYTATLRAVDGAAASDTGSVVITVLPAQAPTVTLSQDSTGGAAPLTVTFSTAVQGGAAASYSWDPDGDRVVDRTSVAAAPVVFTFREAGIFVPRVTVMDAFGRESEATGTPITVTAAAPPAVSLSATGGNIPFASTQAVTAPTAVAIDYDVDGDGRPEISEVGVPPPETFEVHRAGLFTAKVRVTDAAGLSATATAPLTATAIGTIGWMVSPRNGDALDGSSVTLTAEAVPAGQSKSVRFQYRVDSPPGAWTDIGGPIVSSGTIFSTSWNVAALPAGAVMDLRILVDGVFSSGDTANVVLVHAGGGSWDESGGTLLLRPDPARAKVARNAAGVWIEVPPGGPTTVSIAAAARPVDNGSALGGLPVGGAWRIGLPGPLPLPLRVRLPAPVDDATLEVHAYDEAAGVWFRAGGSRVSHGDGWVEAEAFGPGIYALFASPQGGDGGGSRFCSARAGVGPAGGMIALAALMGLWACGRRR